jgi:histidinol-phosphate aminotransferase
MSVLDLVREELKGIEPYRVEPAPAAIRLDANESPLELPAEVRTELAHALAQASLNRYPDILCGELRAAVAAELGVPPDGLAFGNGSDELIGLCAQTFARPRRNQPRARLCYPTPSFVIYHTAALAAGVQPLEVPLRPDFTIDDVALERALTAGQPNLLFLARPNNPTGTLWPRELVERLLAAHPGTIIVADEAYFMYAGEHCLDLLPHYENLLVLRTLSKIGLAGLRVGLLVGSPALVHELEKVRPPYNVGTLAQRAATLLLTRHRELLERAVAEVVRERERVAAALTTAGATVFPARANFILVRVDDATGRYRALLAQGVRVKCFDRPGSLLAGCLRITIGTPVENDALLRAWQSAPAEPGK